MYELNNLYLASVGINLDPPLSNINNRIIIGPCVRNYDADIQSRETFTLSVSNVGGCKWCQCHNMNKI